jgi:hypothetical protein
VQCADGLTMKNTEQPAFTFTVALTTATHQMAQEFYQHHAQPQKAKQVYLNTLSVQAVRFYLKCLGVETDWEQSQSCDPILQVLIDTADLWVKDRGRLECRPVLPGSSDCTVPMAVWSDRIGYIIVQLSAELTEATLLGFLPALNSETILLSDLHPLDQFPQFLNQVEPEKAVCESLSNWLTQLIDIGQKTVDTGWQTIESIAQSLQAEPETALRPAYSFRLPPAIALTDSSDGVKRGKILSLTDLSLANAPESQLLLLVGITASANPSEFQITVELLPIGAPPALPRSLYLMILDTAGQVVLQADGSDSEGLEFQFIAESQERFKVQIQWQDICIEEAFEI